MTGGAELDGDVSDVIVLLEDAFPGWCVTRTDLGVWWARRGLMVRETLVPDGRSTLKAGTAAEMYIRLQAATPGAPYVQGDVAPADVARRSLP